MTKSKRMSIQVQETPINILSQQEGDYISLTDMVRNFDGSGALIEQWLKTRTPFCPSVFGSVSTTLLLIPSNSRELKMRLAGIAFFCLTKIDRTTGWFKFDDRKFLVNISCH